MISLVTLQNAINENNFFSPRETFQIGILIYLMEPTESTDETDHSYCHPHTQCQTDPDRTRANSFIPQDFIAWCP